MTRQSLTDCATMNITRPEWTVGDGEGTDTGDQSGWKLFNPQDLIALQRINIDKDSLQNGQHSTTFPRRCRLSDSAMAYLITKGIPNGILKTYWPLDFNASGGPMLDPRRANMGSGMKCVKNGQTGWATYKNYIFNGADTASSEQLLSNDIFRPNARGPRTNSRSKKSSTPLSTQHQNPTPLQPAITPQALNQTLGTSQPPVQPSQTIPTMTSPAPKKQKVNTTTHQATPLPTQPPKQTGDNNASSPVGPSSSPIRQHNEMDKLSESPSPEIVKDNKLNSLTPKLTAQLKHTVRAAERLDAGTLVQNKAMSATVRSIQNFLNEYQPNHTVMIAGRFADIKDPDKLIRSITAYCAETDKRIIKALQKPKRELQEAQKLGKELREESRQILTHYNHTSHLMFDHDENDRFTSADTKAWAEGLADNKDCLLEPPQEG